MAAELWRGAVPVTLTLAPDEVGRRGGCKLDPSLKAPDFQKFNLRFNHERATCFQIEPWFLSLRPLHRGSGRELPSALLLSRPALHVLPAVASARGRAVAQAVVGWLLKAPPPRL